MVCMRDGIIRLCLLIIILLLLAIPTANCSPTVNDDQSTYRIHYVTNDKTDLQKESDTINKEAHKEYKARITLGLAAAAVTAAYVGSHNWSDMQNKVGVDRVAHFGVSYIICDQLQAAGMNKFWATTTTVAIGAAKEKWIDNKWDKGDFTADCLGAICATIKF
jgi:hypothetical protein